MASSYPFPKEKLKELKYILVKPIRQYFSMLTIHSMITQLKIFFKQNTFFGKGKNRGEIQLSVSIKCK